MIGAQSPGHNRNGDGKNLFRNNFSGTLRKNVTSAGGYLDVQGILKSLDGIYQGEQHFTITQQNAEFRITSEIGSEDGIMVMEAFDFISDGKPVTNHAHGDGGADDKQESDGAQTPLN